MGDPLDGSGSARAHQRVRALCRDCVATSGVDSGGISVLSGAGTPLTLHATDQVAATIEELQFTLGEGPCMDAAASGEPVLVSDLSDPATGVAERWPVFLDEVSRVGVRAVFAFPLRIGAVALGVMDLYRWAPGELSPTQLTSTVATVDAMRLHLLDVDDLLPEEPGTRYPMTVHQAAGMVMVQLGCSIEEALVRLRGTAYRDGRRVQELAADVVTGRYVFTEEQ